MGVTSIHPHRCACAYCRQAHGWQPMTIILRMDTWDFLLGEIARDGGTLSSTIERLVLERQRAGAA